VGRRPLLLAALLAGMSLAASAQAKPPRAVIELYTSQGCSSCPPADELLAKLARDPELIALSLPVDYWDRLGWKDTFAKPAFTERQMAYSNARGDNEVYTPQAVVNGKTQAVGSRRAEIETAMAESGASLAVPLKVERVAEDIIVSVGAEDGTGEARAKVVLLPILSSRAVAIGRGENARRTVTYTNVVRDIIVLGDWGGAAVKHAIPERRLKDYDAIVVLLQAGSIGRPGRILGATRLALR
jgi:hypothetical protein